MADQVKVVSAYDSVKVALNTAIVDLQKIVADPKTPLAEGIKANDLLRSLRRFVNKFAA